MTHRVYNFSMHSLIAITLLFHHGNYDRYCNFSPAGIVLLPNLLLEYLIENLFIAFSLHCLVLSINHLPRVCQFTLWKSSFKQQLVCKSGVAGIVSSLVLYGFVYPYIFILK